MTLKDEILAELQNQTPIEEIRRRFRSQSQLYEAIREFLEEADEIVEERRERLSKVTSGLTEAEAELDSVNTEKEKVSVEVQELAEAKERLSGEVRDKDAELAGLIAEIKELQVRGFTLEILKEIKAVQDRSGPKLLSQVKTVEKYRQVAKDVSGLRKEKTKLTTMVKELEAEKEKSREELVSTRNRLDELMTHTVTFKETVATVSSLFGDGYSSEDVECLKHGLDMLGIKGDPLLSIRRLVEGLSKQKSLAILNENVIAKRQELETLKHEVAVIAGKLKVTKQVILRAVEEVKDEAVKAIDGRATHADNSMTDAAARFDTHLASSLSTVAVDVQEIMKGVTAELEEWGELQQRKGELEKLLRPGIILLGILESPEVLKEVRLPLIVKLLERLHQWSERNLQNATIRPSENVRRKEFNLLPSYSYRVTALIESVYEGLRQIMIQQSLEANAAGETSCQA